MTVSMISQNHRKQLTWRRRALLAAAAALAAGTIFAEVVLSADPPATAKPMLPYDAMPRSASSTRLSDYIQKSSRRSVSSPAAPVKPPAGRSLSDRTNTPASASPQAPATAHLSSRRNAEEVTPPAPTPSGPLEEAPAIVRLNVDRRTRPATAQDGNEGSAVQPARGEQPAANAAGRDAAPSLALEEPRAPEAAEPKLAEPRAFAPTSTEGEADEMPARRPTPAAETSESATEAAAEEPQPVAEAAPESTSDMPAQEAMPETSDSSDSKPTDEAQPVEAPSADATPTESAPAVAEPAAHDASSTGIRSFRPSAATPRAAGASMFAAPDRENAGGVTNPTKRVLTVIGLRGKVAESEAQEAVAAAPSTFAPNGARPSSGLGATPRGGRFVQPAAQEETTVTEPAPSAEPSSEPAGDVRPDPSGVASPNAESGPALSIASAPRPAVRSLQGGSVRGETAWKTLQDAPEAAPKAAPNADEAPFEIIDQSGELSVTMRRSKLLVLKREVLRIAIVDPNIVDVVQFTPRELSLVGKSVGATNVTLWFDDQNQRPITYLVTVEPDARVKARMEEDYRKLEALISELFPDSLVRLVPMADKLIVKGQAKDAEEAAQILALLRNQGGNGGGGGGGFGGAGMSLVSGTATQLHNEDETGNAARPRIQIVNMLRVPGVHQIALRVKIAELNRTAARNFGVGIGGNVNFTSNPQGSQLFIQSMLGLASGGAAGGGVAAPTFLAQFDGDDIRVGIRYMQKAGVLRLLSEPTLVTLSGQQATFVAGGEFAVPTLVGSVGLNAVTTDFRSFGAIISFMPTVVDKDRIRLQVAPEFSQINAGLTNSQTGTPGLNVRAVTTTVEMREGQTFAIAGLLEDTMKSATGSDIPFLHKLLGAREVNRTETELIILVTPELVHPMDPEEVPPLPGFDVTEPSDLQFYLKGDIEGTPTRDWRSPVWPRLRQRYNAGGSSMVSGPFGHGQ